jgi:hypothetical protein
MLCQMRKAGSQGDRHKMSKSSVARLHRFVPAFGPTSRLLQGLGHVARKPWSTPFVV